ncbi:GGDEF domain-containing protein [Saccharospirillum impatiens]|uniref:GGDEF domain-containing protein n=1 Tax=Saccharospirillum impatiens TaxID=169438 RepID=UPI0003F763BC|nr:GGDEF domain-containing protein [Saccharospirillum impatiens]
MERYRQSFRNNNVFVALEETGAYYFNNATNDYASELHRYNLEVGVAKDAWFYQLIEAERDFHLNVNPDPELGVTMLWIDAQIRSEAGEILGLAGTGLELAPFLRDIVDLNQPGITSLFLDASGAIQLYRDASLIDFATTANPEGQKNTVDLLLDTPNNAKKVRQLMHELRQNRQNETQVETVFVTREGTRHLLGIAYLPDIDWFSVTLIDLTELMPVEPFFRTLAVLSVMLVAILVMIYLLLNHWFLTPMQKMGGSMLALQNGNFEVGRLPKGRAEVGRLIGYFGEMAESILRHTDELEDRVQERTKQLETLTRIDPLTNLLNRRGLTDTLNQELDKASRSGTTLGILWIDLDHFKALNDSLGHAMGDQALVQIAAVLRNSLRTYDQAARWGGDEFLIVLADCDTDTLTHLGERIRTAVEHDMKQQGWAVTVSIGGYLTQPDDTLDTLLNRADQSMYQAKQGGRNRFYHAPL